MDSIVDFKICKTTIRGKIRWNILILGNIVHLWFWKYCIALGEDNKSDDLDVLIFSPRWGEFGLFWRQTWSTAPLFPGYGGAYTPTQTSLGFVKHFLLSFGRIAWRAKKNIYVGG